MKRDGVLSGVSVSHANATVEEIERAGAAEERPVVADLLSRDDVREAFALQTCNRAEAYVVTDDEAAGRRALGSFAPGVRDGAVVGMDHEGSIRHLMCVAAGLESLVLGEDQILGQVRTALKEARAVGGIGPVLEDAVLKAVHVGERARSETTINEGVVSLGSAAVELVDEGTDLAGAAALVVGAGEMGTLAARAFADAGIDRLVVANRTVPHAEHVAGEVPVPADAVGLAAADRAVADADVVVTATAAPDQVLDRSALADTGETVVVDLAQPRDVDPEAGELSGVELHDIDDLEAVADQTRDRRREAAERVEAMIDREFDRLVTTYRRKRADEAISAMYEGAEMVKERELETAVAQLEANGELTENQRETVEALADALVNKLLAAPTRSLREAAEEDDWTTIHTAMQLFDPDFGGAPASPPRTASAGRRGPPDSVPEDADIPESVREEIFED